MFYMQDGSVSESLASKLCCSDLAMGFCHASCEFLFIHFHLGQSTGLENHVAACRHPGTSTLKQMVQSAKARREGFPCNWQPGLTAISGDTSTFSNSDKISQ